MNTGRVTVIDKTSFRRSINAQSLMIQSPQCRRRQIVDSPFLPFLTVVPSLSSVLSVPPFFVTYTSSGCIIFDKPITIILLIYTSVSKDPEG